MVFACGTKTKIARHNNNVGFVACFYRPHNGDTVYNSTVEHRYSIYLYNLTYKRQTA